jgi:hypothetical protein
MEKTLKQAAEQFEYTDGVYGFKQGAKWMQERMYSEEEVLSMLRSFDSNFNQDELKESILKKWFEQFKKK